MVAAVARPRSAVVEPGTAARLLPGSIIVTTLAFLAWRATLGFDLRDGSYVISLSQRLARGQTPFVDEIHPQILGALPSVPFTWLWEHFIGVEGVILAHRLFFVICAGLCAAAAWAALSPHFGSVPSALAVSTALLALPYNVLAISYNTSPLLLLLVAYSAGIRTALTRSRLWAVTTGLTAVAAAVTYFAMLPAAILVIALVSIMLAAESRRSGTSPLQSVLLMLGAASAVGFTFVAWLAAGPGLGSVKHAYDTLSSETARGISGEAFYWEFLAGAKLLPLALAMSVIAMFVSRPRGLRTLLLGAACLALLGWAGEFGEAGVEPTSGRYAGALALAAVAILFPPLVLRMAVTRGRRDHLVAVAIVTPATAVGVVAASHFTMSGAAYGAYAIPMSGVVVLTSLLLYEVCADDLGPLMASMPPLMFGAAFMASLLAVVFGEGPVTVLTTRISDGPGAGLRTGQDALHDYEEMSRIHHLCPPPGDVLILWSFGGYVWVSERSEVPQYLLGPSEFEGGVSNVLAVKSQFNCVLAPQELALLGEGVDEFADWLEDDFTIKRAFFFKTVGPWGRPGIDMVLYQKMQD